MSKSVGQLHIEDQCGEWELGFKVSLWGVGCNDVDFIGCPSAGLIRHANISWLYCVLQSLTAETSFVSRLAYVLFVDSVALG
jgi:hypothetical protein